MASNGIHMTLIALGLASLLLESFGEIVMIRNFLDGKTELTCVSEDDGAALVVNHQLNAKSNPGKPTEFLPSRPWSNPECPMPNDCLAKWKMNSNWKVVNSAEHPLGPVFDSRWEDFTEHTLLRDGKHVENITDSGTVVFSVRSAGIIQLKLCQNEDCSEASRLPTPDQAHETRSNFSEIFCSGTKTHSKINQSFVSEHEWRTFVLRWDKSLKEVKTYEVNRSETLVENEVKSTNITKSWNDRNHLLIQSLGSGLVRFHFYKYILTEKKGSTISYQFIRAGNEKNFCIELLVALCSTCQLNVNVVDINGKKELIKTISGVEETTYSKLLTWQISKLNKTLTNHFHESIKLEIATSVNRVGDKGRWAIGYFRKCKRADAVRKSTIITVTQSSEKSGTHSRCHTDIIRCQKLFYKETAVVSVYAGYADDISSSLEKCLRGRGDPSCDFQYPGESKGMSICNPSGCVCAPGFESAECASECYHGKYGYSCHNTCESCKNATCDKSTGSCSGGCNNPQFLPPYCETKLTAPTVEDVGDTTASLFYPTELDWGKANDVKYEFKMAKGTWKPINAKLGDTPSLRMFESTITGLMPGTKYIVRGKITPKGLPSPITSPERNFTTNCTAPNIPLTLEVLSQGRGNVTLRLDFSENPQTEIQWFNINVNFKDTKLRKNLPSHDGIVRNFTIAEYKQKPMILELLPSTEWHFSVRAMNRCGRGPAATKTYRVPSSVGFQSVKTIQFACNETSVTMKIPAMVNTTLETFLKIIVKGSPAFGGTPLPEELMQRVNITSSEEWWLAASFAAQESEPKYWTFGIESTNHTSAKCDQLPNATYVVLIVVVDELEQTVKVLNSSMVYTPSLTLHAGTFWTDGIWPPILLLLLMCLLLFFCFCIFCRQLFRKRRTSSGRTKLLGSVSYNGMNASLSQIEKQEEQIKDDWLYEYYPHPIKLKTFEKDVQMAVENGKIDSDFAMLPRGLVRPCHYGSLKENRSKNRDGSIMAYDDTRVKLKNFMINSHSDYINANYIQGYHEERSYIATQGPIPETISDFWRMIWQEEVRVICMLVNVFEGGKTMCEKYWPDVGKTVEYGHITVFNLDQHVYAHYTYRTFQLTTRQGTKSRKVEHLQYTGWPEKGVPMYSHSIVEYLNELRATVSGSRPIVVHCSTGASRTGTIILCDICLHYAAAEGTADLFAEAVKMYTARANMLENVQQYLLAHLMPTQCLLLLPTKIPCGDLSLAKIEELKKDVPVHMERLHVSSWKDKALYPLEPIEPPKPDHLAKNRFPKYTPAGDNLVKLKRYPPDDSSSEYISAISVDGIRVECQYLASQLPLPSTLADFWRLVAEKRVELIVALQHPSPKDADCIDIIPREAPFNPVPYITVEEKKASDHNKHFTTDYLLLTDESETKVRTQNVTVLTCKNWSLADDAKPPPPETLVSLWLASERVSRTESPTLVICHDGVTGCGLYMALSVLLERMALEQECDVVLAVRVIRRSRAQYIYAKEQFEYLYDAAVNFAEAFQLYSNFM